jgi:signal transduction histidine kinase
MLRAGVWIGRRARVSECCCTFPTPGPGAKIQTMTRSKRSALLLRLYFLGFIQLVVLAVAVFGVGQLIRHAWIEHEHEHPPFAEQQPPSSEPHLPPMAEPRLPPGAPGPPHHGPPHHHGPPLLEPLLTFLVSGLIIVGVGAVFTERWLVRPLLLAERQLLANVSHELRTPLARLRVALDIATESERGNDRSSLNEMAMDLADVEALVNDVLTATRFDIEHGRAEESVFPVRLEPISPNALAEGAAERFRAHHPGRALDVVLSDPLPQVSADPALFRRVLDNLLENAHKYSPGATGSVRLHTMVGRESVVFEVADEGIGIAAEDLPRVFTPFFRADRSRSRDTGGVGLGLTIVKRIVDAHQGTIALESEPNKGTVVRITLPVAAYR